MSSCAVPGQKRRLFKDAGRVCPVDYHIPADAFAGAPQRSCEVLYVVGGLYGNLFALNAVKSMVAEETADTLVVFNGDMHWFDKTADNFAALEQAVADAGPNYLPLVGNVEAELRRQVDVGVGCGCAYPDCTSDESVSRSNRIHKMLSIAVDEHPDLKEPLIGRPSTLLVEVAGRRVGISHGDEKLIGGWDCSRESLQDVLRQDELDRFMAENDLDVFTTTHTCAPAVLTLARGAFINNGAAGLPNFRGQRYGLLVRIAPTPHPDALFGCERDGLHIQAVPVRYDHDAYLAWFDGLWDECSPAAISYRDRIVNGPDDRLEDSLLGGFGPCETARREAAARRAEQGPRTRATKRDVRLALAKLLYFEDMLDDDAWRTTEDEPKTIQVNITARCNLACAHCHVESNPARTEAMSHEALEAVLKVARERGMRTIDITGGAPEMHPEIEWFIEQAARTVERVMLRSNLVILEDPAYAPLIDVYERLGIEIVASLPNVFEAQADAQRGGDTFDGTLSIMRELNARGYGRDGVHILDVAFNPQEPILPPEQGKLEEMYRRRLGGLGIAFDNLFAMANNPIGRYGASLIDAGAFDAYLETLIDSFNSAACEGMMCRHQLSVGWDGRIYDCDFNQALGIPARDSQGEATIFDYAEHPERPLKRSIVFGNHCYACTAGFGSSCGGTLVQES